DARDGAIVFTFESLAMLRRQDGVLVELIVVIAAHEIGDEIDDGILDVFAIATERIDLLRPGSAGVSPAVLAQLQRLVTSGRDARAPRPRQHAETVWAALDVYQCPRSALNITS